MWGNAAGWCAVGACLGGCVCSVQPWSCRARACHGGTWKEVMEVGVEPAPLLSPASGPWSTGMALMVGLGGQGRWSLTARSVFQDPGASFDVNDQDPDPQPRYTQMNDNR